MVEREYAKAMYELALEEHKEQVFSECFDAVLQSLKDKDFYAVMTSPFILAEEKRKCIQEVFSSFDETFIQFLNVVIGHNRISLLPDIYDVYTKLVLEYNDILKIQIFSAVELSSMQMIHLTEALQKKYGNKKIELENIVNPKLIGGIQIVSNGQSIDMSLKNSLEKLKDFL